MQRMEFQARSPATAVQLLLHMQDSAENACSVHTGYVFFGTLVCLCFSHSYIAVHFIEMFFITCLSTSLKIYVNFWLHVGMTKGYSFQWQCIEAVVSRRHCVPPLPGLRLLLGYHYDYTILGSPYTSAHFIIENTLVKHKKELAHGVVLPELSI